MADWTPDTIDWSRFDPGLVAPELLRVVKAAALVEYNGRDYGAYLAAVFADDPAFAAAATRWAEEEVRHGEALARWAQRADPDWDFAAAAARFTAGFRVPQDATASVRGSRTGELIARCVVETGTSSYYSALAESAAEPVLREICRRIAADEFRHYKLFYDHLRRYQQQEQISPVGRARIGLARIIEAGDDELAYAFFAANAPAAARYRRKDWSRAYAALAYRFYRPHHVERGTAMVFKAIGLPANGWLHRNLWPLAYRFLVWRARRLGPEAA